MWFWLSVLGLIVPHAQEAVFTGNAGAARALCKTTRVHMHPSLHVSNVDSIVCFSHQRMASKASFLEGKLLLWNNRDAEQYGPISAAELKDPMSNSISLPLPVSDEYFCKFGVSTAKDMLVVGDARGSLYGVSLERRKLIWSGTLSAHGATSSSDVQVPVRQVVFSGDGHYMVACLNRNLVAVFATSVS
jgi:hypothetical protein